MAEYVYNQDNSGNRVPHGVVSGDPVLASGQTLNSETSATITVLAGRTYLITPAVGYIVLGVADVDTAANIIWAGNVGQTIAIKVPVGTTTLYYKAVGTSPVSYLRLAKDTTSSTA